MVLSSYLYEERRKEPIIFNGHTFMKIEAGKPIISFFIDNIFVEIKEGNLVLSFIGLIFMKI